MKKLKLLILVASMTLVSPGSLIAQELPCKSYYSKEEGGRCKQRYLEDDNGEIHGKYIFYDQNGVVAERGSFVHGKRQGNWYTQGDYMLQEYLQSKMYYVWFEKGELIIWSLKEISSYSEALKLKSDFAEKVKEQTLSDEKKRKDQYISSDPCKFIEDYPSDDRADEARKKCENFKTAKARLMSEKVEQEKKELAAIPTVTIGLQEWMNKNLNVSIFSNGEVIPEAKTIEAWGKACASGQPVWCNYDNDPANGAIYGKLYNWYAVNDSRGLAPSGWRIPTEFDWAEMVNNDVGSFTSVLGGARKCDGYWDNNSNGNYGAWWTASKVDTRDGAAKYFLNRDQSKLEMGWESMGNGFSVRCIANEIKHNPDNDAFIVARRTGTLGSFKKYLADFSKGTHKKEAEVAISKINQQERDYLQNNFTLVLDEIKKNISLNSKIGFENSRTQCERVLIQEGNLDNSRILSVSLYMILSQWGLGDIEGARKTYLKYSDSIISFSDGSSEPYSKYFQTFYKKYKDTIILPEGKTNFKMITSK